MSRDESLLLEFKGVNTYYGDMHALKDVNYVIGRGEIVRYHKLTDCDPAARWSARSALRRARWAAARAGATPTSDTSTANAAIMERARRVKDEVAIRVPTGPCTVKRFDD